MTTSVSQPINPDDLKNAHVIRTLIVLLLFGAGIFARIPLANAPFVNLEYWYSQSAEIISSGLGFSQSVGYLNDGFNNPLLSVIAIAGSQRLFGFAEWSSRLVSIAAWIFGVGIVYIAATKLWTPLVGALSAVLFGGFPLFWVYGGLAYPDVPFTAAITVALLISGVAASQRSSGLHFLAALLFGMASLIRYNAVMFAPVVVLFVFLIERDQNGGSLNLETWLRAAKILLIYVFVGGTLLVPYLLWTRETVGAILVPGLVHVASSELLIQALTALPRLGAYVIWIGVFLGPLGLGVLWELNSNCRKSMLRKVALIAIPINILLILAIDYSEAHVGQLFGELQLGWVERVFPDYLISFLRFGLLCLGEIGILGLVMWGRKRLWPNRFMALWMLLPLLGQSFYRGAQRYTMFVLPPLAIYLGWMLSHWLKSKQHKFAALILIGHVLIFFSLGIFTSSYFAVEGHAAADVAAYINEQQLHGLAFSRHNPVLTNSAYLVEKSLFAQPDASPSYETVALGSSAAVEDALFVRDVELLGVIFKRYAIVESRP